MPSLPRASRSADGLASPAVRDSARAASWAVGLSVVTSALGELLAPHRAGSLAVQAFVVEWGAGRLGVAWSDVDAPPPDTRVVAGRLGRGALLGLGAALVVLLVARGTGAAVFSGFRPAPAELAVGVTAAILASIRDELLLRGVVLRAFQHTLGPVARLVVCALVAAAARAAQAPDTPVVALLTPGGLATLATAALGGACVTTLWLRDRGAWMAFGAHATWAVATTTAISGGLCDATWRAGVWGGGANGLEGSLATTVGLALVTVAAVSVWYRAAGKG